MRPIAYIPPIMFAVIAVALFLGLLILKPKEIPSALIGQPAPTFDLPSVDSTLHGLSNTDLIGLVSIVNVFASWCVPCRVEHPLWVEVGEAGDVPVFGLNYKDYQENASKWLADFGDPYTAIGADLDGRVGVDLGVIGVPETFVVDAQGLIQLKHIGPIDRYALENKILPKVRELQALMIADGTDG
jgi:cytochrome c biogenesis protein CcmG/thiol:disulfide interchange protein DsbE